jgi:hypothetical protein
VHDPVADHELVVDLEPTVFERVQPRHRVPGRRIASLELNAGPLEDLVLGAELADPLLVVRVERVDELCAHLLRACHCFLLGRRWTLPASLRPIWDRSNDGRLRRLEDVTSSA